MLCIFQLLVYLSGDVSNLNVPILCDKVLSMTQSIICSGHSWASASLLIISTSCHCWKQGTTYTTSPMIFQILHTHTPCGDGFLLVQNPSHAKTESHLILLTSDCVAICKLTVWQYATTTPMTTCYCCMALYHVRHAVTLLFETILYCVVPNGQQSVIT
jgi:hypothetical protein